MDDVRPIEPQDLGAVMSLVDELGWQGYSTSDLALVMRVSPEHCFKLVAGGRLVGAMFALTVARVTYISFFIVQQAHRSFRASRALAAACLDSVRTRSDLIVVYANKRAVTAYERVGFKPLHLVTRVRVAAGEAVAGDSMSSPNGEIGPVDVDEVAALDRRCYRVDRAALLRGLSVYDGAEFFGYRRTGESPLEGAAFVRRCGGDYLVGPLLATDDGVAVRLLHGVVGRLPARRAVLELNRESPGVRGSSALSFEETTVAVRKMYCGREELLEDDELLHAVGGHHFS